MAYGVVADDNVYPVGHLFVVAVLDSELFNADIVKDAVDVNREQVCADTFDGKTRKIHNIIK